MTNTQREALEQVVHYLVESERRDYRDASAERQEHRIYRSVLVLGSLLEQERAQRRVSL